MMKQKNRKDAQPILEQSLAPKTVKTLLKNATRRPYSSIFILYDLEANNFICFSQESFDKCYQTKGFEIPSQDRTNTNKIKLQSECQRDIKREDKSQKVASIKNASLITSQRTSQRIKKFRQKMQQGDPQKRKVKVQNQPLSNLRVVQEEYENFPKQQESYQERP